MFLKLGWKHDNNNTNNDDDEYLISAPLFSDLRVLHSKYSQNYFRLFSLPAPHNYETLKWLSSLPTLMQKSFWWWQCNDRYIISLPRPPPLHTPSPRP